MDWKLSLAGLLVGGLVGLAGMGGGSLMTPLLVIAFGFNPTVAIGTDILHGAIFKSVGGIRHRRLGTVHARLSGWMFLASAPMSLVGVWVASWIERTHGDAAESVMGRVLAVTLMLGAVGLFAKSVIRYRERSDAPFLLRRRDRLAALAIGFFGGFIVGLTSVGTGVFFGLTMLIVFPLRAAKVVGTDIFHAAALLWVAGAGHLVAGNVDMSAVGWLVIGSVPGVLIASQFTLRMPERVLRVALASVLLLSGIKLLDFPQGDAVLAAAACGVAIGFGAWALAVRAARRRPRQALSRPAGTD
ncbi:MAG: sulfite exporter TauE/SafE family protein [Gaiellaceae bacterium]